MRVGAITRAGAIALGGVAMLIGGCATSTAVSEPGPVPARARGDVAAACATFYSAVDAAVDGAGVRDVQEARIEGFPYLRVNRELASLRHEALTARQLAEWTDELAALDVRARRFELANLPPLERVSLAVQAREAGLGQAIGRAMLRCATVLRERDARSPDARDRLVERATVPSDYDDRARALGLYPLARVGLVAAVERWQRETRAVFDVPVDALPRTGTLVRHAVDPRQPTLSAADVPGSLAFAEPSRFGLLRLPEPALMRLFATYAPQLDVDEAGGYDRIGALRWRADGYPGVDAADPVVYVQLAHARLGDRMIPQLVYVAWFDERPARWTGDPLAGRLDGIVWRVTLGPDGVPLVYDTIHPCGCFHLFFPTDRARTLDRPEASVDDDLRASRTGVHPRGSPSGSLDDPPDGRAFVPQRLDAAKPGERVRLRIESGTHYVQRVLDPAPAEPGGVRSYRLVPLDTLRSLPIAPGQRRSLFGQDALVPGTERPERFILWPSGVRSPGAMRQWGHHATALAGERHFDDPTLIERYFALR